MFWWLRLRRDDRSTHHSPTHTHQHTHTPKPPPTHPNANNNRELFEEQSDSYKESVFPKAVKKRVAVEAGCSQGWHKYVTDGGKFIGIDSFGASAPAPTLYEKFGITVDTVYAAAKSLL